MKNRFENKHWPVFFNKTFLFVVGFLIIITLFLFGIESISENSTNEQLINMEKAIIKTSVHCYSLEGAYPPSLEYIEENYGIVIDHDKFIVHYDIFASNMLADITIIPR